MTLAGAQAMLRNVWAIKHVRKQISLFIHYFSSSLHLLRGKWHKTRKFSHGKTGEHGLSSYASKQISLALLNYFHVQYELFNQSLEQLL